MTINLTIPLATEVYLCLPASVMKLGSYHAGEFTIPAVTADTLIKSLPARNSGDEAVLATVTAAIEQAQQELAKSAMKVQRLSPDAGYGGYTVTDGAGKEHTVLNAKESGGYASTCKTCKTIHAPYRGLSDKCIHQKAIDSAYAAGTIEPYTAPKKLTKSNYTAADGPFAFPRQKKEPISTADEVRAAWKLLPKVKGVSEADRATARKRILAAAKEYGVDTSGWDVDGDGDGDGWLKKAHTKLNPTQKLRAIASAGGYYGDNAGREMRNSKAKSSYQQHTPVYLHYDMPTPEKVREMSEAALAEHNGSSQAHSRVFHRQPIISPHNQEVFHAAFASALQSHHEANEATAPTK